MALEIYLRKHNPIPGAHINGSITVRPPPGTDFDPSSFSISLVGISETRIITGKGATQEVHESSNTFLKLEEEIETQSKTLEWGHVCHFHIAIPEDPVSARSTAPDMLWLMRRSQPQTLPPSWDFGSGNTIVYSLEASLFDEVLKREIKASRVLEFCKDRAIEVPDPQIANLIQEKPLAAQDNINSQSTLKLALECPQVFTQAQRFPLTLRLLNDHGRTKSSPPPEVLLKSCLVEFLAHTSIKTEDNAQDRWTEKHTIASFDTCSTESHAESPSIIPQGLDLAMLFGNTSVPLHHPPTFESRDIEHSYGVGVSAIVECEGDAFEFKFEVDPVTVLAAVWVGAVYAKAEAVWARARATGRAGVTSDDFKSSDDLS
ncbi:hypothetical protein MMC21_002032 [Puttea exsequens]|nr:hypothetical protein [Puttea exsequens]